MLRSLSRTLKATPTRILSPRFQSTSKEPDSTQEEARRERVQANLDQEERKRHRRVLQYTGLFTVCSSLVALAILGRKESETQDSSISAHLKRAWSKLTDSAKIVSEPQWEKLLPDVLPDPYQRPFTLVLELNDALVHLIWDACFI